MSPRIPSHTARAVLVAVLVADLAVAAAAARVLVAERRELYAEAERRTENLARVLGESIEGQVRLIALALDEARAELERGRGKASAADFLEHVARLHAKVGFLDDIRTSDASGRLVHGLSVVPGSSIQIADRDYFLRAKAEPGAKLIVSAPLVSRVSGRESLMFATRTNGPDGTFGGVVYAVVLLEQFTRTLAGVDVGRDGTVALRDRDLALIARQPAPSGPASPLGQRSVSPGMRAALDAGHEVATFVSESPVDHKEKVTTYRRVADGAFYLIVSSACDEFLADWRASAYRTGAAVLLFALLTVLGARLLLRSWTRESETRFRELIEEAPIAVAVSRGERTLYVNRQFFRMLGVPPAGAAPVRPIQEDLVAEDAARVAERIERRMRGLPVEPTIDVRLRRPDGAPLLATVTDETVQLADGPAVVAFLQDVTERKRAEAERELLIGDLRRALAEVKTLSGLLPICAHCKKIRDDQGYWNRIEVFFRERSGTQFTHGICPDCAEEHFPEGGA